MISSLMSMSALPAIHVFCAAVSISGYLARGVLMLRDSALLNARWVRTVPHGVDTVLLASGVALAWSTQQYPIAQTWLTAKIIALLAYIVVGAIGLRYGRTKTMRTAAFIGAILIFAYIVGVAVTRRALLV